MSKHINALLVTRVTVYVTVPSEDSPLGFARAAVNNEFTARASTHVYHVRACPVTPLKNKKGSSSGRVLPFAQTSKEVEACIAAGVTDFYTIAKYDYPLSETDSLFSRWDDYMSNLPDEEIADLFCKYGNRALR